MTSQTLLILGASGDLTARLLLPGLGRVLAGGEADGLKLLGSATETWDDERWRARVRESFASAQATGTAVDEVVEHTRYLQADVTDAGDLRRLLDACTGTPIIYFALPPAITEKACQALTDVGLPEGTRLAMEKPFGTDAASAEALNALVVRLVPEDHVHRIDHFLGMSTVLNLLGLRFANRIVEPLLRAEHVERVEIVYDETLGLEGRARYYDHAGALVDMIQSHLLQVLSLFAMEAPSTLAAEDIRDARAQVLRAVRVWDGDPVSASRRARYTAGELDGRKLPAYADEEGIPESSTTETLAQVTFAVETWRWAGVPFVLRSGKALGTARKSIVVTFRAPPWIPTGFTGSERRNRLEIGLGKTDEGLELDLNVNGPGAPTVIDPLTLEADFGAGELPAYGEVLKGLVHGDPTLSIRGDMAVDCWRIVTPVLGAWRADEVPLETYSAGSDGPDSD